MRKHIALGIAATVLVATPALAATMLGSIAFDTSRGDIVVIAPHSSAASVMVCNKNTAGGGRVYYSGSGGVESFVVSPQSCAVLAGITSLTARSESGAWQGSATVWLND